MFKTNQNSISSTPSLSCLSSNSISISFPSPTYNQPSAHTLRTDVLENDPFFRDEAEAYPKVAYELNAHFRAKREAFGKTRSQRDLL